MALVEYDIFGEKRDKVQTAIDRLPEKTEPVNVTCEERTLKWLNDNIDFFTKYRANPINANRTAFYNKMIEQQRTAISAIETCRQLKNHYLATVICLL